MSEFTQPPQPRLPLEPDQEFKQVPEPNLDGVLSVAADDSDAQSEAVGVATGSLEQDAKRQEHARTQALRNQVHRLAITAVWIIFAIFVLCAVILAWHVLAPARLAWLSPDQETQVKTFVFSTALTSAAGGYLAKRVNG